MVSLASITEMLFQSSAQSTAECIEERIKLTTAGLHGGRGWKATGSALWLCLIIVQRSLALFWRGLGRFWHVTCISSRDHQSFLENFGHFLRKWMFWPYNQTWMHSWVMMIDDWDCQICTKTRDQKLRTRRIQSTKMQLQKYVLIWDKDGSLESQELTWTPWRHGGTCWKQLYLLDDICTACDLRCIISSDSCIFLLSDRGVYLFGWLIQARSEGRRVCKIDSIETQAKDEQTRTGSLQRFAKYFLQSQFCSRRQSTA